MTPVNDRIDEGEGEALQLLAQTTSGLVLRPASFELTIEDDDEKGIVLSRRSLQVREEGRGTYTVKLKSQPTGPVTVDLNGEGADAPDLTIEPTQLEFTANDWNATKTVTVSAAEDPDGDDGTASIAHTASGGDYGGVQASLPVTVDDIDQTSRSVQLSLDPDLVEEDAGAVQVTVTAALNGAARSTDTAVAVQATGGTAQAGTDFNDFGTVTVTIPTGLTSATQTFSFSPVDDNLDEGLSETAIFGGTVQGLSVRTATLTIADNDGRGIELSQGPVTLDEASDTTYQVSLATEPTGTVTVRVTVAGNRDVSASPGSLTFTALNWDQSQTVTVMAARDDDDSRHGATAPLGHRRGLWRGSGPAAGSGGAGHEHTRRDGLRDGARVPGRRPDDLHRGAGHAADGNGDGDTDGDRRRQHQAVALFAQFHTVQLENGEDGDGAGRPGPRPDGGQRVDHAYGLGR